MFFPASAWRNRLITSLVVLFAWICPVALSAAPSDHDASITTVVMNLDDCISAALQNNHRRPASQFAVAMAEARHRQALSGYWPHVTLKAGYERMDEAPNFLFPASQMYVPPQTIQVPAGTALINVPAGVLAPVAVQLPVSTPSQTVTSDGVLFPIPEQDIKLMDRDSVVASVDATWLIYDGGMRRGYTEQAAGYKAMMEQEARRTDLEIIDSVTRLYYGSVLARRLHQVGDDTHARMVATLNLTETMYKEGSGAVKKTDYLDNKIMVSSLRSMIAQLAKNEQSAQAAELAAQQAKLETDLKDIVAKQEAARKAAGQSPVGSTPSQPCINPSSISPIYKTSDYGMRFHPILQYWRLHAGVDLRTYCGTKVYAAASGTVQWARYRSGYGNQVMINDGYWNGKSLMASYNHLSGFAVSAGQQVSQGDLIGYSGNTGTSAACHLHFEVYVNGATVDPWPLIAK